MPGCFITLDGGDGCGKTTQLHRLVDWLASRGLAGNRLVVCRDPGGTPLGDALRSILLNRRECPISDVSEMLLFMASRAQLVREVIRPALAAGKIVLCDRFLLSTLVYQGYAGGVQLDIIDAVASVVVGETLPDVGLVLDVSLEVAQRRRELRSRLGNAPVDRMEAKAAAYHQRVRDGFIALAQREPQRYQLIDASADAEAVTEAITEILDNTISRTAPGLIPKTPNGDIIPACY